MVVLEARNVHQAFPKALDLLRRNGVSRPSRYGDVLQYPDSVTTVYTRPTERVLFWKERDANPFFHLYESLWMLAGRNDVTGPKRYAKRMETFSDDGQIFHGAYGWRWRNQFPLPSRHRTSSPRDQLKDIALTLQKNHEDRRCVLQMWDASEDLGRNGKDVPCNTIATFQVNPSGALDLTVFCRSNDVVWGCYGANAVHFSVLLEYMAAWIRVPVGTYTQVSVNWHGYKETVVPLFRLVDQLTPVYTQSWDISCPYAQGLVRTSQMTDTAPVLDKWIHWLLEIADYPDDLSRHDHLTWPTGGSEWVHVAASMFYAHRAYRRGQLREALEILSTPTRYDDVDWIVAGREWIQRRIDRRGK